MLFKIPQFHRYTGQQFKLPAVKLVIFQRLSTFGVSWTDPTRFRTWHHRVVSRGIKHRFPASLDPQLCILALRISITVTLKENSGPQFRFSKPPLSRRLAQKVAKLTYIGKLLTLGRRGETNQSIFAPICANLGTILNQSIAFENETVQSWTTSSSVRTFQLGKSTRILCGICICLDLKNCEMQLLLVICSSLKFEL